MARSSLLGFAVVAVVALSGVACNRVRVEDVRGPDGGERTRVSCRYYFANSAGPAPAQASRNSRNCGCRRSTGRQ